ncbi:MAG TPA: hypothetical protein VGG60_08780, partial [Candidatus Binataceae bacterium]
DLRATIARIIDLARGDPDNPFYAIWQATLTAPGAATPSESASSELPPVPPKSSAPTDRLPPVAAAPAPVK